jgi:hypothetical protein
LEERGRGGEQKGGRVGDKIGGKRGRGGKQKGGRVGREQKGGRIGWEGQKNSPKDEEETLSRRSEKTKN